MNILWQYGYLSSFPLLLSYFFTYHLSFCVNISLNMSSIDDSFVAYNRRLVLNMECTFQEMIKWAMTDKTLWLIKKGSTSSWFSSTSTSVVNGYRVYYLSTQVTSCILLKLDTHNRISLCTCVSSSCWHFYQDLPQSVSIYHACIRK